MSVRFGDSMKGRAWYTKRELFVCIFISKCNYKINIKCYFVKCIAFPCYSQVRKLRQKLEGNLNNAASVMFYFVIVADCFTSKFFIKRLCCVDNIKPTICEVSMMITLCLGYYPSYRRQGQNSQTVAQL